MQRRVILLVAVSAIFSSEKQRQRGKGRKEGRKEGRKSEGRKEGRKLTITVDPKSASDTRDRGHEAMRARIEFDLRRSAADHQESMSERGQERRKGKKGKKVIRQRRDRSGGDLVHILEIEVREDKGIEGVFVMRRGRRGRRKGLELLGCNKKGRLLQKVHSLLGLIARKGTGSCLEPLLSTHLQAAAPTRRRERCCCC